MGDMNSISQKKTEKPGRKHWIKEIRQNERLRMQIDRIYGRIEETLHYSCLSA